MKDLVKAARHGALLVVATVGLATLVSGCGGSGSSTATDETTSTTGNEVTVPVAAVRTDVVDPGAAPRERIAPSWAAGVAQHATLHTENGATQRIDTQADQDFSTPPLTMPLDAATRDGGIDLTIGAITTPDAHLQQSLVPTAGSHAGFTTAANGSVTALEISPAPNSDDAARRAIEQALYQAVYQTVAFPDAEIGVGAVWTIEQQISGGVTLDQVTTAKLLARSGNTLTIGIDVRQTPRSDQWNLPNGAGELDIDHYDMHGTGTLTVDLGLPLPVDGSVSMSGDQGYSDPEGQTHLNQSTTSVVRWSR